jgi:uncharacterized protein YqhQ
MLHPRYATVVVLLILIVVIIIFVLVCEVLRFLKLLVSDLHILQVVVQYSKGVVHDLTLTNGA